MRLTHMLLRMALLAMLTGCNGTSGENGDDPFGDGGTPTAPVAPVVSLSLALLDGNCEQAADPSFTLGDTVCVQATLTEDGAAATGEIIEFSAGLGTLSADDKLTDSNGIAEVTINSANATTGAASIVASYGETSTSANYEFLAAAPGVSVTPELALTMLDMNGNPVNRFKADEQVRLSAQLEDAEQNPIVNTIVQFQVERGLLTTDSALTDAQGNAEVVLNGDSNNLGAAVATAQFTLDDVTYLDSVNFEIQSADAVEEQVVKFGYFDNNEFVEGEIGASVNGPISAGGTLGLSVAVVTETNGITERILTPTLVTFSSICVQTADASIDQQVTTVNGEASTTYEDLSCAGGSGNTDTITASITVNNSTVTLSREVELLSESIGAIEFISAQPENIVLIGTGGQGSESISTVTFQVNGELGNPLAQQQVSFSLNTETGGLSLSPVSGLTNSDGQVSTRVTAGSVPTAVRVTAETSKSDGTVITTQSDLLTVNTGLPDQNSMTLSASDLNPEAFNINGQQVTISASLADTFNNPVPDGTAVAFTTEGGFIEPSCTTTGGVCSVTWTSANPRPDNHRVTILATAVGHETLVDSNGNNVFDDEDGGALDIDNGNGFGRTTPAQSGFVDLPEAWRDDNEDGDKDVTEIFLDFDGNGEFDGKNGLFDGPQCISANDCGLTSLHVRKALVLIMSSSSALLDVFDGSNSNDTAPVSSIARGSSALFRLEYSDTAIQPIASGSSIEITSTAGTLGGTTVSVMPLSNAAGVREQVFSIANELGTDEDAVDATVTVTITSPSGVVSTETFIVSLL